MKTVSIMFSESELSVLLDALDIAMDSNDCDNKPAVSRMFDRVSEVAYELWDDESV